MTASLAERVRHAWVVTSGVREATFSSGPAGVAVAPDSGICPAGWVGVVVIGDRVLATAPTVRSAEVVAAALETGALETGILTPEAVAARLPAVEVLGPARLSYRDGAAGLPWDPVGTVPAGELTDLLASAGADDARESGLAGITSPAWVVRTDGQILAAAGYTHWPDGIAHLSVLTAPTARNRGLAGVTAAAAVSDAVDHGLLPQWRARPAASQRVATRLGFQELGWQLSLKLAESA